MILTYTLISLIGILSYVYNRGLEEQQKQTEQWRRELNALIQREIRREDEEDRSYQEQDNEQDKDKD